MMGTGEPGEKFSAQFRGPADRGVAQSVGDSDLLPIRSAGGYIGYSLAVTIVTCEERVTREFFGGGSAGFCYGEKGNCSFHDRR